MKVVFLMVGMIACAAGPMAAQWLGEPVWNSPKGGTGLTISGDYARPNTTYGKGNTWGGRAALGLGTLTVSVGVASWKPDLATKSITSFGGNADFRLIGGSLLPVAVNLQAGAAHSDSTASGPAATRVTSAVGISVPLPTPGFSVEPYFSPGIRHTSVSGGANATKFGYAIGANLSFGVLGAHLAYDNESVSGGGNRGVFGVGLHAGIHLPLGM